MRRHPFARGLDSCGAGHCRKATSFADLPLAGQPGRLQRGFIPAWKNGQSVTQRLTMMMMVVTGAAASQAD